GRLHVHARQDEHVLLVRAERAEDGAEREVLLAALRLPGGFHRAVRRKDDDEALRIGHGARRPRAMRGEQREGERDAEGAAEKPAAAKTATFCHRWSLHREGPRPSTRAGGPVKKPARVPRSPRKTRDFRIGPGTFL